MSTCKMTISKNYTRVYYVVMIIILCRYRPLRSRACQHTDGLTSICPQTEVKGHSSPSVVGFLDWDFHCKLVAIHFPRDIGLSPTPYTDQKFLSLWELTQHPISNTSSKDHFLNHVITDPTHTHTYK